MMKKYIISLLLCFVSGLTYGQVRWGAEAGVNVSHAFETDKTKAGFNVGVRAELPVSNLLYLDGALKLSSQPCGYDNTSYYYNDVEKHGSRVVADFTPYYLTLPVRIGVNFSLSESVKAFAAVGPMIGVGLFGTGSTKHFSNVTPGSDGDLTGEGKLDNVFKNRYDGCFTTSRFEYGANLNVGIEFQSHYRLGFEYSLIHIPGDVKSIDNMNIYSINIGYVF